MSWLEEIRNSPQHVKVRWVRLILIICFFLLVFFWIAIGNHIFNYKKGDSIFKVIREEITNEKSQNTNYQQ